MKKKLTKELMAETSALRDRVVLTVKFMDNAEGFGVIGTQLIDGANSAFDNGDLRALRLLAADIDKLTIGLAEHQREGLEALLKARLGVDKEQEREVLREQVRVVLSRGRIDSEKQRRRLEDYLEMLEATGGDPSEIEAVRRLVSSD